MKSLSLSCFLRHTRCDERMTEFCVGDKPEINRFYNIEVGIADRNNATIVHDTCRVIVMPKAKVEIKQELRGNSGRRLSKAEVEELVSMSSESFFLGSISFRSKVYSSFTP